MEFLRSLRELAFRMQWRRGLRAALAVAAAILVCQAFGKPFGWAALGGFEAILVDNGGPYRSRLITILTVLSGGAFAGMLGSLVALLIQPGAALWQTATAALATAAVCFLFTFARVATQPLASTSVIILVLYFAGLGSGQPTFFSAGSNALSFVLGGAGAALISLVLWPLDPFRPARRAVATTYRLLAEAAAHIATTDASKQGPLEEHDWKRQIRLHLEEARTALGQTAARAPARTHRARNLTVLLETADMLFARSMRLNEFAQYASRHDPAECAAIRTIATWLGHAEHAIAYALLHIPADNGASFGRDGSHRLQFLGQRSLPGTGAPLSTVLAAEDREALQELEIAFDALHALWSGVDRTRISDSVEISAEPEGGLLERLRADWSLQSIMPRHALRMAAVGAIDVLIMRSLHVSHGFWLAMTSIIVLQPSGSGTMRRGLQRVAGTIAGGFLAALLAAVVHNQIGIMIVITVGAGLTLAAFAVDYGVYAFFLTPTFVLMSLPYLRDWRYAGVRIVTTILGAAVAVLAMRFFWPEREDRELSGLLHAGAAADAAYLRAMLRFWNPTATKQSRSRRELEKLILAPARRACGLASNAAEEMLDRLLLEPSFGRKPGQQTEHALAFTTYLRRLAQTTTTLAALGHCTPETATRIESLAHRLESLPERIEPTRPMPSATSTPDVAELQIQRIERQVAVLERAASAIATL